MKKLLVLFILLTGVVTLSACEETVDPVDPVDPINNGERIDFGDILVPSSTIRVWMDDENGEYMAAVIAEFNKVHPNIIVEFQHMGSVDSRELLKTFGPSGNGADIFQFPHDQLSQAVLEDLVLPLPTALKTALTGRSAQLGLDIATLSYDETNGSFDPNSANAVESLYAVPLSLESIGLFYNTDLITTPAATFEALLAAAAVWNAAPVSETDSRTNAQAGLYYLGTTSHFADSYFMQPFYSAFGFTPFGPNLNDASAVGFANTVAALEWMRDSLKPAVTGSGDTGSVSGGANFENGDIPYVIGGPWNHEAFIKAGVNYNVAPFPTINGQATRTYAGAMMAAVYKYSKNTEDAIKFVEFLTTDIAMELMYEYKNRLPGLEASLLSSIPGLSADAKLLAMSEQLKTSVPMPTIPQVTYYWGPGETMIKDVWNSGVVASVAAATAEESYRARVALAGQ
jgi:arabinogalactan oligomer / maltooligosaccharide transport system substrate-binding protein